MEPLGRLPLQVPQIVRHPHKKDATRDLNQENDPGPEIPSLALPAIYGLGFRAWVFVCLSVCLSVCLPALHTYLRTQVHKFAHTLYKDTYTSFCVCTHMPNNAHILLR